MSMGISDWETVKDHFLFYITWVGGAITHDTHHEMGDRLKGKIGVLIESDERLSHELTEKFKNHSASLKAYLERASGVDGQLGIVYITTIRPDKFGDKNYGVAICKLPTDRNFDLRCKQLPGILISLSNTNNIYEVEFWDKLLKTVGEIFGRNVFPLGRFGGALGRIH